MLEINDVMKQIELYGKWGKGNYAQVSDEDYKELSKYRWYACKGRQTLYAISSRCIKPDDKEGRTLMHRLVMGVDGSEIIDHIDHNGLNNQRSNLRVVTSGENLHNRIKSPNTTSKYIGVCRYSNDNKGWCYHVGKDRKKYKGYDATEIGAAIKYNELATNLYGKFARLNEISNEDIQKHIEEQKSKGKIKAADEKWCAHCKNVLNISMFTVYNERPRNYCRDCVKSINKMYWNNRKQQL